MELTLAEALERGITAHREGKLEDAERFYRAILQAQPDHPDGNHNLGVLAVSVGKVLDALPFFKQALEANSQIEQFWLSYIDALIKLERFDEAVKVAEEGQQAGISAKRLTALSESLGSGCEKHHRAEQKREFHQSSTSIQPTQEQIDRVLECYQAQQFAEAEALAVKLTENFPEHPFAWRALGTLLEKAGRATDALAALQKVVELTPGDGNGHSNLGVVLKNLGRSEEAEASLRKAVALNPDYANAHNNLGNLLRERGSLVEAEGVLRKAIELQPDFAEAHNNLAATLRELDRLEEARDSFKKAVALKPEYAEAHNNLGNTLRELGNLDDAQASLGTAVSLKPNYAEAYSNLGITLAEMGSLVEAEVSFRKAVAIKPDYGQASHMLASLTGETTSAAPLDYVAQLFDGYASKFDASLVATLHYQTPRLISERLLSLEGGHELGSVLDLGCGSGLLGVEIAGRCARLEGVDVSARMLAKARERGIYDKLVAQDIFSYLSHAPLDFNFFIAADVFVYVGDLSDTFRLIKSRNRSGARLIFSTEHEIGRGFSLQASGRFAHSKAYVERLGSEFGYELNHFELHNIRLEKGEYIQGGLYLLSF